jgi:hypothetical protein
MENCEPLAWYGAMVLVVTGGFILVPFLRGKSDLISAWNIFLVGVATFIGLGCLEAASSPIRFHGTQWFQPTRDEVHWYMAATTVFLVTLFLSHYFDPLSRALAARSLNNWPPISTGLICYVLIVSLLIIVGYHAFGSITFIGQTLAKLNHKAIVFIPVFSFILWYRNKLNVLWFGLFAVAFLATLLLATLSGGGRRLPLSVLLGPVFVVYMAQLRHWRPTKSIVAMGVICIALLIAVMMYSSIRHASWGSAEGRTASALIESIKKIAEKDWLGRFVSNKLFFFSQQNVHYSLITDRFVRTGQLEPKPLNTLKFIAVYPIPRQIYPNKPRGLGEAILREAMRYPRSSWGCGISGHAAYEGGLLVAALYAYLAAAGIRFIDDPLQRQPTNPFLLAVLVTSSTHILTWPRGDIFNMTVESAQSILFAVIIALGGRLLFGTERQPVHRGVAGSALSMSMRPHVR